MNSDEWGGHNKQEGRGNKYSSTTMFTEKKYAFEQSSTSGTGSNYFNVDKYFENFKEDNFDIPVSSKTLLKNNESHLQ